MAAGTNESVFTTKHEATPKVAISAPARRGATMRAAVYPHLLERVGVGDALPADEVSDERTTRGGINGPERALEEREGGDAADGDVSGDRQGSQHRRRHRHARLGDEEQPALVVPIGDHAAHRSHEEQREELGASHEAERHAGTIETQDQPRQADPGDRADDRRQLRQRQQPELAQLERSERASEVGVHACTQYHCLQGVPCIRRHMRAVDQADHWDYLAISESSPGDRRRRCRVCKPAR